MANAAPVPPALVAAIWSGCASENVPLIRRPVANGLGSATLSVEPSEDVMTLAVVDAL